MHVVSMILDRQLAESKNLESDLNPNGSIFSCLFHLSGSSHVILNFWHHSGYGLETELRQSCGQVG